MNHILQDTEMLDFLEVHWWKIDDIASSTDIFAPRRLFAGLKKIWDEGLPQAPLDIGD